MCIVIDTNTFSLVFSGRRDGHEEFRPVLRWIVSGKGKIVYGGSKYRGELRRAKRYLGIVSQFKKAGKVVEVNDQQVDARQRELEDSMQHRDFDDPHIIAIVIVSGCKLVCSNDSRAYRFVKMKELYPSRIQRPKIYRGKGNEDLLCDQNIADICRPCDRLRKQEASALAILTQ